MRFSHIADCHIGSWRDSRLGNANLKAFLTAMDISFEKGVDFVLISGDLFNTALPAIEQIKGVVAKLREAKDRGIAVYYIAGSHDFSASGKTMLGVLEKAGLMKNAAVVDNEKTTDKRIVMRFITDKKTGAKITGLIGKKGMLEKSYYEMLDREILEKESGFKIFMFHTALSELKTKDLEKMEAMPLSLLPKNFDYYAGGHVHKVIEKSYEGYKNIIYPGPVFPNNFKEIEELKHGGFYIYDNGKASYEAINLFNVFSISVDCSNKSAEEIKEDIVREFSGVELIGTIVTIRLYGKMLSGKISDIGLNEIIKRMYEKNAYFVMKNTSMLKSPEFEEIKVSQGSVEDIEDRIIKEHLGQIDIGKSAGEEAKLIKALITAMSVEKAEGERNIDFANRIKKEAEKILGIELD